MIYKRITKFIFIFVAIMCTVMLTACEETEKLSTIGADFSVSYLNLRYGNSTLVKFGNGKTLLIDTGFDNNDDYDIIKRELGKVDNLDYLILSSTDINRVGNVNKLCKDYNIKKAYVPYIINTEQFTTFNKGLKELRKECPIEYNDYSKTITEDEAELIFLSPQPNEVGGEYNMVNFSDPPTEEDLQNVSPIIYLGYKGTKFVFLTNSGKGVQSNVQKFSEIGLYSNLNRGVEIDIREIDYLELSGRGDNGNFNYSFTEYMHPKNAIISVNGNNNEELPDKSTLYDLMEINSNINIFRTDILGTVKVSVNRKGERTLFTDVKK